MYEGKNDYDTLILRLIALRSGGRRLAVRTAMEHHIGALPRTPFPASRDFPSRGNEKIGGTGYCVTYDTDSQSRNADFILIARKGDTATLGAKGPVKLKNPWARKGPSILRTFFRHALQGVSKLEQAPIYSCSSLFQLVPACSTGTDFHLCDFMKLFQLVPSCSTACSTGFLSHHRVRQANGTSGTRYYL